LFPKAGDYADYFINNGGALILFASRMCIVLDDNDADKPTELFKVCQGRARTLTSFVQAALYKQWKR